MSEQDTWESRYSVPEFIFGREPNYFLQSCGALLPVSGRALAIADGEGRNGVWLAEQGLSVVCLDFSESAQRKATSLAQERGVNIALVRADIHSWSYPPTRSMSSSISSPSSALRWNDTKSGGAFTTP